jgi:hypothetical protein
MARRRSRAQIVKPEESKRYHRASRRTADGDPPCWPWRRNRRGKAREMLNSRLAWALRSASFHPEDCLRRQGPKRSRYSSRSLRRPVSTPARRPKSSRNRGPSLGPKRCTTSSRRPGDSPLMLMMRARQVARAVPGFDGQTGTTESSSARSPVSSAISSSPGSTSAGGRQLARKLSIEMSIGSTPQLSTAGWVACEAVSFLALSGQHGFVEPAEADSSKPDCSRQREDHCSSSRVSQEHDAIPEFRRC